MEELLKLLSDIRDDVDFENETELVDGKILTSFDSIQIIGAIDDEYYIAIPAPEIVPKNFNSAEALLALIERLKG